MQGVRKSIITGQKTEVTASEVEGMVVELTRINKSLTTARGRPTSLHDDDASLHIACYPASFISYYHPLPPLYFDLPTQYVVQ